MLKIKWVKMVALITVIAFFMTSLGLIGVSIYLGGR